MGKRKLRMLGLAKSQKVSKKMDLQLNFYAYVSRPLPYLLV